MPVATINFSPFRFSLRLVLPPPFFNFKKTLFLTHYQTLTGNMDDTPGHCTYNIHGHTHQEQNESEYYKFMYHVGVDSHNCYPVHIDEVIEGLKNNYLKDAE